MCLLAKINLSDWVASHTLLLLQIYRYHTPDVRSLCSVPFGRDENLYPTPNLDILSLNFAVPGN
jgi:hypothetical protein